MKDNQKRLKADLALGVRKFGLLSLMSKLDEFPIFDNFFNFSPLNFLDLDNFWDLDVFWPSDLPVFGFTRFDPSLNPSLLLPTSPILSVASTLAPSTLFAANTYDDIVVFSIDVSGMAILLKFLMN